jgi:hypothetical protein
VTEALARKIDQVEQVHVQNWTRLASEPAAIPDVGCQFSIDKTGSGRGEPPGRVTGETREG